MELLVRSWGYRSNNTAPASKRYRLIQKHRGTQKFSIPSAKVKTRLTGVRASSQGVMLVLGECVFTDPESLVR
jgi:hypothetical protein